MSKWPGALYNHHKIVSIGSLPRSCVKLGPGASYWPYPFGLPNGTPVKGPWVNPCTSQSFRLLFCKVRTLVPTPRGYGGPCENTWQRSNHFGSLPLMKNENTHQTSCGRSSLGPWAPGHGIVNSTFQSSEEPPKFPKETPHDFPRGQSFHSKACSALADNSLQRRDGQSQR